MKPDRFAQVKELILKVADLPEKERKDFLDEACKDDPELREEVESFLVHEEESPGILKTGGAIPGDLKEIAETADMIDRTFTCWRMESLEGSTGAVGKASAATGNWPDELSQAAAGYLHSRGIDLPWDYSDEFGGGEYRVTGLRCGGLGVVLIVEFSRDYEKRTYAAKTLNSFLRPDYLDMPRYIQEKLCGAFLEEALPWLEMGQHPHIVPVQRLENILHPELDRQVPFIYSEFMPRGSLRNYLEEKGNSPIQETLALGIQLCEGLLHAYDFSRDAHLDIKPENILVDDDNLFRITDFSANVIGTPGYMAPEQVAKWWREKGEGLTTDDPPVDHRADQFAVALVMLEAFLGYLPIAVCTNSVTDRDQARMFIEKRSPEIDDLQIPDSFRDIVNRLLSPAPEDRYPDPTDLRNDLVSVYEEDFGAYTAPEVRIDDSADWWFGRGQAFHTLGHPAEAAASFEDALKRYGSTPGMEVSRARCQLNLGKVNCEIGCYSEAEEAVKKALVIFNEDPGNWFDLSDCLMMLGWIFVLSARYLEAEKAYGEALKVLESNPATENQYQRCISGRAMLYLYTDRFNEAEKALQESIRLCRRIPGFELNQAKALVNLGNVYDTKGNIYKAIESYEEAIDILYRMPGTEAYRAACKMNTGNALNQIGRYSEAREAYNEARSVYERIPGTQLDQANCAMNLGMVYANENRNDDAKESIHEALKIFRNFPGTELEQAKCLESLGSILCGEGHLDDATEKMNKALRVFQKLPGTEHYQAICTVGLATIYRKTGDLAGAEKACNEAMKVYGEIPATEYYQAACAAELALIHRERKDLSNARQYAREAEDLCKSFPPEMTARIRSISREILGDEDRSR